MRLLTLTCSVAFLAAGGLAAQNPSTAQKKAAVARKPGSSKSKIKSSVAKKTPTPAMVSTKPASVAKPASVTKPTATAARRRSSKPPKGVVATRRYTQQQPAPDRLREIQQALTDRGYFSGPVDGTWGPASVDALKRFQREQSLTDDGKIGSLSLIALGLGPKRVVPAETALGDRQAPPQR